MQILDGKALSESILEDATKRVEVLQSAGVSPHLTFFLIGDNPASLSYVLMKERACKKVGVVSEVIRLRSDVAEQEVLDLITSRNADTNVHGIMVQLRIPEHLDERKILQSIAADKDVDGLHQKNQLDPEGKGRFAAATAKGVMLMLEHYGVEIAGKKIFLMGRTNLFGIPFRAMISNRQPGTVGYYGRDWQEHLDELLEADVVVSAIGGGKVFITPDMVKNQVTLVDVGLGPDIAFDQFLSSDKKGWITPTRGGTGPMTVASIVLQTVESAERYLQQSTSQTL
jgi:methylenetetrahydrofolate dehydrogenase (NADP+) / methenyltetrahydrofolate cyclohydrolase